MGLGAVACLGLGAVALGPVGVDDCFNLCSMYCRLELRVRAWDTCCLCSMYCRLEFRNGAWGRCIRSSWS